MDDIEKLLEKELKDPEFRAEWEAMEPEFQIAEAIAKARAEKGLTQQQLKEASGIAQGDISKLENCSGNPSLRTLKRLAAALGTRLKIEFVPVERAQTYVARDGETRARTISKNGEAKTRPDKKTVWNNLHEMFDGVALTDADVQLLRDERISR